MELYTCDPNLEVMGFVPLAFFGNLDSDVLDPIMRDLGIDIRQFQPEGWYKTQDVLDILRKLQAYEGTLFAYVAFGKRAAETAYLPPETQAMSFADFLVNFEKLFPARDRNGSPGYCRCQKLSDHEVVIRYQIPYPDDVFYGMFYGYGRRLLPKGTNLTVTYESNDQRRDFGCPETALRITW